jgi:pimeloyl-ACP methyl ester carboxylesterase
MRILRRLVIVALIAAVLVWLGYASGNQPRRDALAAAEKELGIDLESRRVDLGDVTLHVVMAGPTNGKPVVLLHGFPEFWYAWYRQVGRLAAAGFRVIVPDQRGYNDSDKPPRVEDYDLDKLARDIANLAETLGYEKADVAAHDWGGGVAWQLAIHHPNRIRKLVIIDTPHPRARLDFQSRDETINWFRTFFQIPWLPEWSTRLFNWYVQARMLRDTARPGAFPDEKMDLYRSAWDNDGAYSTMIDWYRAVYRDPPSLEGEQRVSVPTLLVVAPDDRFIPSDLTRASAKYLDDGRVLELETGTHWVLQEDPEGTSRILIDFFSE